MQFSETLKSLKKVFKISENYNISSLKWVIFNTTTTWVHNLYKPWLGDAPRRPNS